MDYRDLDKEVREGLKSLPKGLAERVGRHLVMAGRVLEEDPKLALEHAAVARRLASRIGVVREGAGLTAYLAGEWQIAISELRTAQRLNGTQDYVAIIADCERALGRPERAVDAWREADQSALNDEVRIELLIVAAGARRDLGQDAAAVGMLQVPELTANTGDGWLARLRYAYADALKATERREEAIEWFTKTLEVDPEGETEATERLLELEGVVLPEIEDEDEILAELASSSEQAEVPAPVGERAESDDESDEDDDSDDERPEESAEAEDDDEDEDDESDDDSEDENEDDENEDEDDESPSDTRPSGVVNPPFSGGESPADKPDQTR
ncbi:tetratricopeptide repeat protein [Phytomonospora endophytica]|uniref:Tetratricopeptide (TPR) repeat protein n=1 Tax=Phytomonospora endophytica TaxID=714109 RepID=A0A841FQ64_9ACTN|nr:tetratricopeptide repeat protein [Phytomonospora endophytica]MBB6035938.1 tetratricopeptide (TPR) repeat protein [Phytomonospora endophytica]GIG71064.1 hypothetical protein Pen01_73590 [Phytomonospora endophytica]